MSLRSAMKESSTMGELLLRDPDLRPVVFYAEDAFTFAQYEGYVLELLARSRLPIVYVTSDAEDPLFANAPAGLEVRHIDRQLQRFMSQISGSLLIMTMPDLGRFHVPKPERSTVLYVFHSLNSVHTAYREGAFDSYDAFACTGPHHVRELSTLRETRGAGPAELHEVGYYKLDRIARAHAEFERAATGTPEVLLAPSWGRQNLLEAHGEVIVESLLGAGFDVTVRPHPQFFHSLYPEGAEVMRRLQGRFGDHDRVAFDLSVRSEESFHSSALMISDWSGAAFEYALGTCRPVLFIDTPPKIFNPDWRDTGLPAFEDEMRSRVGQVVPTDAVTEVGARVMTMLDDPGLTDELASLRERTVFNPGHSAAACADLIERMVGRL
jgi:YidC/Oxa1 family membrane protein insertase